MRSICISVSGSACGALLGVPLVQAGCMSCQDCSEANARSQHGVTTTRHAVLIVPLIFAGPLTNSASHQAHTLSSPEANGRSPLPPGTSRVIAAVQRVRVSSMITTQRTQFSLFPSARCAHQKLGQFAKARPQPTYTGQNHTHLAAASWPRLHAFSYSSGHRGV